MGFFKPNVEKMKAKEDVEGLIKALEHKDQTIRANAVRALGEIGDKKAIEPLIRAFEAIRAFQSQNYMWLKEDIIAAIGEINGERAVNFLISIVSDTTKQPFYYVQRALVKSKAKAVSPLLQCLVGPNKKLRRVAAELLNGIIDERSLDVLLKALTHKDNEVRIYAADFLGKIGDERAVEPLIQALNDSSWNVRANAAEALGKIGSELSTDPLVELLDDENSEVRWATACSLWIVGNEIANEAVKKMNPPDEVKARRKTFNNRYPGIIKILSAMEIAGIEECTVALESYLDTSLPLGAKELLNWGKGSIEDIVDILATCGGVYPFACHKATTTGLPFRGKDKHLNCERIKLRQEILCQSVHLSIIHVNSKTIEHYFDGEPWSSWVSGELYMFRIPENEYLYYFSGSSGNGFGHSEFTIGRSASHSNWEPYSRS